MLGYRLVIVCSTEGGNKSPIISKLHLFRRDFTQLYSTSDYQNYLKRHFCTIPGNKTCDHKRYVNISPSLHIIKHISVIKTFYILVKDIGMAKQKSIERAYASNLNTGITCRTIVCRLKQFNAPSHSLRCNCSYSTNKMKITAHHNREISIIRSSIWLITSTRAGMGKSSCVRKMTKGQTIPVVKIPLHGPIITSDGLMKQLREKEVDSSNATIHLDIAPTVSYYHARCSFQVSEYSVIIATKVLSQVDTLLFELLVLGAISDKTGRMWRRHRSKLHLVEITLENSASVCIRVFLGVKNQTVSRLSL